jgi:hypothetical protein
VPVLDLVHNEIGMEAVMACLKAVLQDMRKIRNAFIKKCDSVFRTEVLPLLWPAAVSILDGRASIPISSSLSQKPLSFVAWRGVHVRACTFLEAPTFLFIVTTG